MSSAEQFGYLTFDVVMFVSGLHHVLEIEHVLQTVIELLVERRILDYGTGSAATGISYGLKHWTLLIGYSLSFRSVSAVTHLPVRSILRFPNRLSQLIASKEFGVRRSRRCCCGISTCVEMFPEELLSVAFG